MQLPTPDRDTIIEAYVSLLKTIRPPIYRTDLRDAAGSAKVFRRALEPEKIEDEGGLAAFPELQVLEFGYSSPYVNQDRTERTSIRLSLFGFVREDSEDLRVPTAPRKASRLHDDIVQATLSNPNLGRVITGQVYLREHGVFSGTDPRYALVRVNVEIMYHLSWTALAQAAAA